MKISMLISLLILAVASVIAWKQHQRLSVIRVEHQSVLDEAAELGVSLERDEKGGLVKAPLARQSKDREAEGKAFAAEVIAFAKRMKEREENGDENDDDFQREIMEMMKGFLDLDATQLKVVIAEIKMSREIDDEMREGIIGFSIMMLANENPEAALALYGESSELLDMDGMGELVISSSLARLAERDPFAAMDWIRENGKANSGMVTDETKAAVVAGAARQDPAMAIQLVGELGMKDSHLAAEGIAKAAGTPEERLVLLETLRTLDDGKDLKRKVLSSMSEHVIEGGYEASIEWLAQAELSGKELEVFGEGLSYHQTQEDTGKWLEWIGESYSGGVLGNRTGRLMREWTRRDFQAAGTWLNEAKEGAGKSAAVVSYAETVAPYEPAAAAQWALTLPEGKKRNRLISGVHKEWKKRDEAAAAAFAAEQGIE